MALECGITEEHLCLGCMQQLDWTVHMHLHAVSLVQRCTLTEKHSYVHQTGNARSAGGVGSFKTRNFHFSNPKSESNSILHTTGIANASQISAVLKLDCACLKYLYKCFDFKVNTKHGRLHPLLARPTNAC